MALKLTSQFKKDLKRYKYETEKLQCLQTVLHHLKEQGTIPAYYRPHLLSGEYKNCMECHIQNDFLLIWMDQREEVIKLLRLGSHSELFK